MVYLFSGDIICHTHNTNYNIENNIKRNSKKKNLK